MNLSTQNIGRQGDWLETVTGKEFWPIDPNPDEVCIGDIAHALSNICRFNGHTVEFYSVAQHSCLVHDYVSKATTHLETRKWALLHDASEAYICDIPRPLKPYLNNYKSIELNLNQVICVAFEIRQTACHIVHDFDDRVLGAEGRDLMPGRGDWWKRFNPVPEKIEPWTPAKSKREFCRRWEELQ